MIIIIAFLTNQLNCRWETSRFHVQAQGINISTERHCFILNESCLPNAVKISGQKVPVNHWKIKRFHGQKVENSEKTSMCWWNSEISHVPGTQCCHEPLLTQHYLHLSNQTMPFEFCNQNTVTLKLKVNPTPKL